MTIQKDEVISLMNAFHDVSMIRKGTADEQAAFFLRPAEARVYVPHGEDLSMQANYELHRLRSTSGDPPTWRDTCRI